METIKALVNLSNKLDQSGLTNIADKLDKTSASVTKIVKAQFEGGLGYAIRNSRCWGNCYRQNRAKQPGKSSQEIILSCWEEYNKSIGDNESGWEKYADKNSPVVKLASQDIPNKIIDMVGSGTTVSEAMSFVEYEERQKFISAMFEKANDLVKIASELKESNQEDFSNELLSISKNLAKEAGFWGGLVGKGEVYKQGLDHFKQDVNIIKQLLQGIISQPNNALNYTKKVSGFITKTLQNLRYFQDQGGLTGRAIRSIVTQAQQSLLPYQNVFLTATDAKQVVQSSLALISTVDQLLQQAGLVEQQVAEEAEQQEGQQGQQEGEQQSQDIMTVIQSADEAKLTEIVNNIMSNPEGQAAARQWFISTLHPATSASYNLKKYKISQVDTSSQQALPEITPQMIPQIMAAVSNKFGPKFNQWFSTTFESVLGFQSATKQTTPQAQEEIGMDQAVQILRSIAAKAMEVLPDITDDKTKRKVQNAISRINNIDKTIQFLEGTIAETSQAKSKYQQQDQMMGYHSQQGGAGELAPGSGVVGATPTVV